MTDMRYFGFSAPAGTSLAEAFSALGDEVFRLNREGIRLVKVYAGVNLANATGTDAGGRVSLRSLQDKLNAVFIERLGLERAPALTLAAQRPLGENEGSLLCAEILAKVERTSVRQSSTGFSPCSERTEVRSTLTHVIIESEDRIELWSSGFHADYGDGTAQEAAAKCFKQLSETLSSQGFTFDDIFRQWNYIGRIVDFRPDAEGRPLQNYQAFNEVRAGFYASKQDKTQYPAATGIGMDYDGVCIDFVAVKEKAGALRSPGLFERAEDPFYFERTEVPFYFERTKVRSTLFERTEVRSTLRSPVQTDAFSYNQEVLVGDNADKKAPLFERGRRHDNTVMISGTASIRGQETVDKGDADKQLANTVGFIEELVHHNIKEKTACTRMRLYVKPGIALSAQTLESLEKHYPAPCLINIVEADICRPDLLIEIEADLKVLRP